MSLVLYGQTSIGGYVGVEFSEKLKVNLLGFDFEHGDNLLFNFCVGD
jgi:hypothetical protein